MRELGYERRLRVWAERRGHEFEPLRYPRPAAGGETVAYRLSPPDPRAVLVLVHGTGNDALFALPGLIREALQRNFEVFTFDLDGHGRGSTTVMHPATILTAVPEALVRARGERRLPLNIWGISLGGSLALHALSGEAGEEVEAAVIVSAPTRLRVTARSALAEVSWRGVRAAWRERHHSTFWEMIPAFGSFKRSLYPVRLAREERTFGYVGEVSRLVQRLELPARAAGVRAQVLLVYGSRDLIVPPAQGWALAAQLPRARLLQVEEGSHLTTFYGEDMAARCLEWMENPRTG